MASDVEIVAMVNEFKPIDIKELPQAVQDAIKKDYAESTIKGSSRRSIWRWRKDL